VKEICFAQDKEAPILIKHFYQRKYIVRQESIGNSETRRGSFLDNSVAIRAAIKRSNA